MLCIFIIFVNVLASMYASVHALSRIETRGIRTIVSGYGRVLLSVCWPISGQHVGICIDAAPQGRMGSPQLQWSQRRRHQVGATAGAAGGVQGGARRLHILCWAPQKLARLLNAIAWSPTHPSVGKADRLTNIVQK